VLINYSSGGLTLIQAPSSLRGARTRCPAGGAAKAVFGHPGEAEAGIPSKFGFATGDQPSVMRHILLEPATLTFQQLAVVGEQALRSQLNPYSRNLLRERGDGCQE
jgi:hypothetical protein